MPTVTQLDLFAVDLPFKVAFRHAAAARTTSDSLFLRARLDNGAEGWGESLPRAYVSGEAREQAFALLRDTILPALVGQSFRSLPEAVSFLEKCDGKAPPSGSSPRYRRPRPGAASTWRCWTRSAGHPESRPGRGSGFRRRGRCPWTISLQRGGVCRPGWPYAVSLLKMRAFRFPQVKLKLEHDGAAVRRPEPLGACSAAGSTCGSTPTWPGTWSRRWRSSSQLRAVGIRSFEQPIAADDLAGLARLVAESSAQIMVDEGLTDRDSLQRFIAHRACTAVNVRISKCGGLVAAYARCREALDAGLMLQVGCQVGESSLLSAAHLTLLSALAPLTPGRPVSPKAASGAICFARTRRRHWSSSATAAVRRVARRGPGSAFRSTRRRFSDASSTRPLSRRLGERSDRCRE